MPQPFTDFNAQKVLANQLNDALHSLPWGLVTSLLTSGATATTSGTTELVVDYVSFVPVADRTYRFYWLAVCQGTVAGDAFRTRVRFQQTAGALTSSGTAKLTQDVNGAVAALPQVREVLLDSGSGGDLTAGLTYAIGVTAVRSSGTGTWSANGGANSQRVLHVEDVGPA